MAKPSIRPDDDHYPTPPEVTRALLWAERFSETIWEPCAGSGEMVDVLRAAGYDVFASTLGAGYYGQTGPGNTWRAIHGDTDFLCCDRNITAKLLAVHKPGARQIPDIVTNPPYKQAEEFIRHALGLKPRKCAMLLNIKFMASRKRHNGLWREYPPSRIHMFVDRPSMYPAGYEGKRGSTTETFGWFVWDTPPSPPGEFRVYRLDSREFA